MEQKKKGKRMKEIGKTEVVGFESILEEIWGGG